jgi:cytoskeletal protein CcmA (bactofilin family)
MSKGQNLTINGSGDYPGGYYDKITIRGDGNIVNDVDCDALKVYGTCEAFENVITGSIKVFGEAEVKGNMSANDMLIMGNMVIGGTSKLKKIKILGTLDSGEDLSGNEADIKGSLSVKGDVEYEEFVLNGGLEVKGLLNADRIKIVLRFGESTLEEIGGGKITIKKKSSFIPFGNNDAFLTVNVIEGDEIFLENTKADVVRGNKVQIGSGCQIGLVEYTTDFSQDASAMVKMSNKR